MKAQKFGLVLGVNVAVACLVLQGCKANKDPRTGAGAPPSRTAVTPLPAAPEPTVAPEPVPPASTVTTVTVEPEPPAPPTQVKTVKPLPPVAQKPAVAPKRPAAAPSAPAAASFVYTVKAGDQLFAVSRRYNVRMAAITKANPGLNPDRIRPGQKIVIPGVSEAAVAHAAPAKDAKVLQASAPVAANTVAPVKTKSSFKPYAGPTKEYKVKSGDSLGKIAYEHGIQIRALKELNKLSKDALRVGQTLLVPAEKAAAPAAKPAAKDAKAEAAKDKKAAAKPAPAAKEPAKDAKADAQKKDAAAETAPAAAEPEKAADEAQKDAAEIKDVVEAAAAPAPAAGPTYTVKEGDDLVSVAIAWGINPSSLMDLNDLKAGDALKPGQVLKLPASAKQAAQ